MPPVHEVSLSLTLHMPSSHASTSRHDPQPVLAPNVRT